MYDLTLALDPSHVHVWYDRCNGRGIKTCKQCGADEPCYCRNCSGAYADERDEREPVEVDCE